MNFTHNRVLFLKKLIPPLNNLNKKTKNRASRLTYLAIFYFHSSLRGKFRTLLNMQYENQFAKMVNNFKSINIFAKSSVSDAYVCGN